MQLLEMLRQNSVIKRLVWKVGLVFQFFTTLKLRIMKSRLTNVASICFVIFLFNCFFTAKAQTNKNRLTKFYLQGAAGASTRSGDNTELSLQGVVNKKWSFTLSYHDLTMQPKNLPADYQAETGVVLF